MNNFLLITSLFMMSCTMTKLLGEKASLTNKNLRSVIPESKEYSSFKFYVVTLEQIQKSRSFKTLTYLGTDSSFHYFRTWNKLAKEGEIFFFAVRKELCQINNPRTIDEEVNFKKENFLYHVWRNAKIVDGFIVVN